MDEDKARQYYIALQTLHQQLGRLNQHLQEIEEKTMDLRGMAEAITSLESLPADAETLVPLTNGVFYKTSHHDASKLYLNVGAGVVISRSPQEAREILTKQERELETFRKQVEAQRDTIEQQAAELEERIASEV